MKYLRSTVTISVIATAMLAFSSCDTKTTQEDSSNATMIEKTEKTTDLITTNNKDEVSMKFELVKLPYAPNALEPVISQKTVELHHGKHLQTYVNNLNKLIEGTEFADMDLVDIVKKSEGGIFNNAGQTLNHDLYFLQFNPKGGGEPTGDLLKAIESKWGSFAEFKKTFEADATGLFGAGWAWLATDKDGKLQITKEQNAGNPVTKDLTPLMGVDVWEHAYYVDYENRRAEHLSKVWDIIDWNVVADRYAKR